MVTVTMNKPAQDRIPLAPSVTVERVGRLRGADMHDLCDAADAAIEDGGGFGWLAPPARQTMETYWKGVLLVPERELIVGRLDRTIAGSAQLVRPARNNEAQARCGQLTTFFVAPWARGHGLARRIVESVEKAALEADLDILNLDVRETQAAAIKLYEALGYVRWGTHPNYARIGEKWITGYFYFKNLRS
jgi:ribosomal protein S18 acetylase RimI-like enzyme